ncbi:zinc-binding dehydrogenase [Polycladomyces subterraneus]|uniref:Zinc-binding dehydrogenase n=1 Tax=Polycladomyces subterraneus TaxID=1016997 RepID=A0ABT8IIR8_9BACL|nr:zinc-binding dehydrogenase [Polycladomyces subterraneus]MDN4592688.1 zinc-binding dehydrogenase [Polycladomyces subterraneus]
MKAIVLREFGGPEQLRYEEVPDPTPGRGEVVVRLKAAALNRRDYFITINQYPGIRIPAIPGSDGAGIVVAVGEGVDSIAVGSEVVINPTLNWGDNPRVQGPDFQILGVPTDGTYAQLVKVPAENVFPKPEYLSWEEAAALPLAALTAYRALITRGRLQPGETVFIPGIGGGVATFLLQIAVATGARVFVSSRSDEKIERALQLGAAGGVNVNSEKWVKELQDRMEGQADLCVDSVGGDTFTQLIRIAKPGGRIVTFGATRGPVPNLVMPLIFLKQLDILGSTMGNAEEFEQMLSFFKKHEIRPVIDRSFPLEQASEALKRMQAGDQFGKILLEIPE